MWRASNIKAINPSLLGFLYPESRQDLKNTQGLLNLPDSPLQYLKMNFSKIIQTAFLLALSVPAQAWNRLDKDNAVSHKKLSLLWDRN
jgi:hypothetical protein